MKRVKSYLPLVVIGIIAVFGAVFLKDYLTFEQLRDNRETLVIWRDENYFIALFLFAFLYILVVAFSLPGGLIMTLTGSFLFGFWVGLIATIISATTGATIIFLAAKTSLGDKLHAMLKAKSAGGGMLGKMEAGLHKNQISYLFLMRLIPVVPFFIANLAPAFMGVRARNYVVTTFFGIIPGTAVTSSVGAGLGEVFERGESLNLGIMLEWTVIGPIFGLCMLALLPVFIKKFKGKSL